MTKKELNETLATAPLSEPILDLMQVAIAIDYDRLQWDKTTISLLLQNVSRGSQLEKALEATHSILNTLQTLQIRAGIKSPSTIKETQLTKKRND